MRLAPASGIPTSNYRVQLVDDHHMLRLGLIALAKTSSRLQIEWLEAGNLSDALAAYGNGPPIDLVVLDLNLPDSQGLQGLRRFLNAFPGATVAVFSATSDEFVVRQALGFGAVGFMSKAATAEGTLHLIESLLEAARGVATTQPGSLEPEHSPHGGAGGAGDNAAALRLSARAAMLNTTQLQVLELLLAGMSNQEIAAECQLALGTVKNAVSSIYLAMDVQSRSHLLSLFR
ncbi:MAG: response regulator transcription factor [Haliea sp.]|nr:MAG: response regulator transcription factor [Haliea sp.]